MKGGYVAAIAARASEPASVGPLVPAVRSASPLAEFDQRLHSSGLSFLGAPPPPEDAVGDASNPLAEPTDATVGESEALRARLAPFERRAVDPSPSLPNRTQHDRHPETSTAVLVPPQAPLGNVSVQPSVLPEVPALPEAPPSAGSKHGTTARSELDLPPPAVTARPRSPDRMPGEPRTQDASQELRAATFPVRSAPTESSSHHHDVNVPFATTQPSQHSPLLNRANSSAAAPADPTARLREAMARVDAWMRRPTPQREAPADAPIRALGESAPQAPTPTTGRPQRSTPNLTIGRMTVEVVPPAQPTEPRRERRTPFRHQPPARSSERLAKLGFGTRQR